MNSAENDRDPRGAQLGCDRVARDGGWRQQTYRRKSHSSVSNAFGVALALYSLDFDGRVISAGQRGQIFEDSGGATGVQPNGRGENYGKFHLKHDLPVFINGSNDSIDINRFYNGRVLHTVSLDFNPAGHGDIRYTILMNRKLDFQLPAYDTFL